MHEKRRNISDIFFRERNCTLFTSKSVFSVSGMELRFYKLFFEFIQV